MALDDYNEKVTDLEGIQFVIFSSFSIHKERNRITWDRTYGFLFEAHTVPDSLMTHTVPDSLMTHTVPDSLTVRRYETGKENHEFDPRLGNFFPCVTDLVDRLQQPVLVP